MIVAASRADPTDRAARIGIRHQDAFRERQPAAVDEAEAAEEPRRVVVDDRDGVAFVRPRLVVDLENARADRGDVVEPVDRPRTTAAISAASAHVRDRSARASASPTVSRTISAVALPKTKP